MVLPGADPSSNATYGELEIADLPKLKLTQIAILSQRAFNIRPQIIPIFRVDFTDISLALDGCKFE